MTDFESIKRKTEIMPKKSIVPEEIHVKSIATETTDQNKDTLLFSSMSNKRQADSKSTKL